MMMEADKEGGVAQGGVLREATTGWYSGNAGVGGVVSPFLASGITGAAAPDHSLFFLSRGDHPMRWTKPEFEVVEVTMEVTAYVARR